MHLAMRRQRSLAKVAMDQRPAIRLYWMWRNGCAYSSRLRYAPNDRRARGVEKMPKPTFSER